MADYSLTLTLFTPSQIDLIQGHMARIIRLNHGLPQYFPTFAVFDSHKEGGIGTGSLFKRCIQNTTRDLTNTLNDQGRTGMVSRALGLQQYTHWKNHPSFNTTTLGPIGRSSIILRQLHFLAQTGITYLQDSQPIPWIPPPQPLHSTLLSLCPLYPSDAADQLTRLDILSARSSLNQTSIVTHPMTY